MPSSVCRPFWWGKLPGSGGAAAAGGTSAAPLASGDPGAEVSPDADVPEPRASEEGSADAACAARGERLPCP